MEKGNKTFADTNYFAALFNPADSQHFRAIEIAKLIDKDKTELVISSLIFSEIITILSQRRNRPVAIEAGKYLLTHPYISVFHIDEYLQNLSWQIFQEAENKNISFVDCSVIAVMGAANIKELLTFDQADFKHLKTHHQFSFYI